MGKKKNAAARLVIILANRWTGNKLSFMDSLEYFLVFFSGQQNSSVLVSSTTKINE